MRRFIGVGIGTYEHPAFAGLTAPDQVRDTAALLAARGFAVDTLIDVTDGAAEDGLAQLLPADGLVGAALVVLWAGHGEPTPTNDLRLITTRAAPNVTPTRTARQLTDFAVRTGANQILLMIDTCFSGGAMPSAAEVIGALREAFPDPSGWIGVLASARSFEQARDDLFAIELARVLSHGPRDPALRLRFNAFNTGVRGDDLIDVVLQEWPAGARQRPDALSWGVPRIMFPNPRWDPDAVEVVVEHLLLAAEGRGQDEIGSFFTGRRGPLQQVVTWLDRATPGVLVVTGPAGCGKSAVVGRVVSLSNPVERARILAAGDPGPDPGENAIHAHVHARRLTLDGVAEVIDVQLRRRGLLPPSERRNANALLGAVQSEAESGRLPVPLRVVIDGLDEADADAARIATDLVTRLAGFACIVVASRRIRSADDVDVLESMATEPLLDLGDPSWANETEADLRAYVAKRLHGHGHGRMDAAKIGDHVLATASSEGEGAFLLARVATSQLRATPVDTDTPGWEAHVATSIEAAIDADLAAVGGVAPCGVRASTAARELLAALTWGYGAGLPDDVWATIATALSGRTTYGRDDVYWLLGATGRYVVASRGGDVAVYRLSHQRLAHHLRPPRPLAQRFEHDPATLPVADAIMRHYRSLLAAGMPPDAHEYLWQYSWRHCADAGDRGIVHLRSLAESDPTFRYDLAMALVGLGLTRSELGRPDDAVAQTKEAIAIYRSLVGANPARLSGLGAALDNLGRYLSELGRPEDALAPAQESIEIHRSLMGTNSAHASDLAPALTNLGRYLSQLGRPDDAERTTAEALGILRSLAAVNPVYLSTLATALNNVALFRSELGRPDDAEASIEEAIGIYRALVSTNPTTVSGLAAALTNLGRFRSELGRPGDAVAPTEEAIRIYRPLVTTNPAHLGDLAMGLNNLAGFWSALGRPDDAVRSVEESIAIYRPLATTNPTFHGTLAMALTNLGWFLSERGRSDEAVAPTEEAIRIYRPLAATNPAHLGNLAIGLNNLAGFWSVLGRPDDAERSIEEAIGIYRPLATTNPAFLGRLAMALTNLGRFRSERGRSDEAVAPTEEAIRIYRPLVTTNPAHLGNLAMGLNNLAGLWGALGRPDNAVRSVEESIAIYRPLATTNPAFHGTLAVALTNLGLFRGLSGRPEQGVAPIEEALAILQPSAAANPVHLGNLALAWHHLGLVLHGMGRPADAVGPIEDAIGVYRPLAAANPAHGASLARALHNLGVVRRDLGRAGDAVGPMEEAIGFLRSLAAGNSMFLDQLSTALNDLSSCYLVLGRQSDIETAWQLARQHLPPDGAIELWIRRAARRESPLDAVRDLVAALEQLTAGHPLHGMLHEVARSQRATDPQAFDDAWTRAGGSVPDWLSVPPAHLTLVRDWKASSTYAQEASFAVEHADQLLAGPTELALRELALLWGDPTASEADLVRLDDARRRGFAAAYEPVVAHERISTYLRAGREDQIRSLDEDRAVYLTEPMLAALDERTSGEDDGGFGAGLLRLAARGLDRATLAALADASTVPDLVERVVRDGDPAAVIALGQTMAGAHDDPAARAFGYVIAACGNQLDGRPDAARGIVHAARRLHEATVHAFLPTLAVMIADQPALAALVAPIAGPLPAAEEED